MISALISVAGVCHGADRDYCVSKVDGGRLKPEPRVCTYEPTTLGWTDDSDDVGFMDFKLSIRYQVYPFPEKGDDKRWATYFAFTGRFAQYLNTRESSPVVAKRLNPKVFYRRWSGSDYFDIGYNHESNGQSINTVDEFNQAVRQASLDDGRENAAYDQISRGWDYIDFVWRKRLHDKRSEDGYLVLKYFLQQGLLQGEAEEYGSNFMESDPQGKPRRQVQGIAAMYKRTIPDCPLDTCKVFASYETGYEHIGKYNTFRLELGFKLAHLPLMIWGQTGYGSDLSQYYKKVESIGLAVELGSF
jgi:hypothetical protein